MRVGGKLSQSVSSDSWSRVDVKYWTHWFQLAPAPERTERLTTPQRLNREFILLEFSSQCPDLILENF